MFTNLIVMLFSNRVGSLSATPSGLAFLPEKEGGGGGGVHGLISQTAAGIRTY